MNYSDSILWSLRLIIRSIDKHNTYLSHCCKLTLPQILCLKHLLTHGPQAIGQLAQAVYLSKATLTGIIDRLETKNLVRRDRSSQDRRKIMITLTQEGDAAARNMPWPLQERLRKRLSSLSKPDIQQIDETLRRILEMMEAPSPEALEYKLDAVDEMITEHPHSFDKEMDEMIIAKEPKDG